MKKIIQQLSFSKEINLIFLSTFLFATSMGINFVTLPSVLSKNGIDAGRIGIAVTCDILAGIFISFFLSRLSAKLGILYTLFISSSLYAAALLLIYFYQNFYLWLGFCFIIGSSWFTFVIIRQACLNALLTNIQRGIGLGVLSTTISIGFAFGPIAVNVFGSESYYSFIASATLALLAFITLLFIKIKAVAQVESKRLSFRDLFKHCPRCFLAKFFLDAQYCFLITFTIIFGKKIGLSAEKSGILISSYMISGLFDVYVGFLLKKYNPYKLINIGFLGSLTLFTSISIYYQSYLFLLIAYFILGVFAALIYVSTLTIINQTYPKEKLVAANATLQSIGLIGALFSSLFGGYLINIFDYRGFTMNIILGCIFYLTFLVIYEKKFIK